MVDVSGLRKVSSVSKTCELKLGFQEILYPGEQVL